MKLLGMKKRLETYKTDLRASLEIHASMEYYAEQVNEHYPDDDPMISTVQDMAIHKYADLKLIVQFSDEEWAKMTEEE